MPSPCGHEPPPKSLPATALRQARTKQLFHLDQVPLPFTSATQKTLNPMGEQCVVKQPGGSGVSKRFCTLQICICADADCQCVKPEINLKGKA